MTDTLGWMLVHAAWEGGVIAIVIAVLLAVTRGASASARYAIALAGLAATVAAPMATTALQRPSAATSVAIAAIRADAPAAQIVPDRPSVPISPASGLASIRRRIDTTLPLLVTLWFIGIGVLSLRLLTGVVQIRRLGTRGVSVVDARVRAIAAAAADRLGVRGVVQVLQSTRIDAPMLIGWLRPAVLVPASLLVGVTPAQLEMLIAHELAHIRRYDTYVNLAQTIIETLLFFHPAVWWLSARVRDEREHCCDDLAIAACGGDVRTYGTMLLLLEETRRTPVLAAASNGGSLLRRVRRLALGSAGNTELGPSWFAGVGMLLAVILALAPTRSPLVAAPSAAGPTPAVHRDSTLHQQSPRTMPMKRSTTLATVAALAIAAGNAQAQSVPNVAGRWRLVESMPADGGGMGDKDSVYTIEQSDQNVSVLQDGARLVFRIESANASTIRVRGPVGFSLNADEPTRVGFAFDASGDSARFHINSDQGTVSFAISTRGPDGRVKTGTTTVNLMTSTLSLDRNGDLIVENEVPQSEGRPPKRSIARFRRA